MTCSVQSLFAILTLAAPSIALAPEQCWEMITSCQGCGGTGAFIECEQDVWVITTNGGRKWGDGEEAPSYCFVYPPGSHQTTDCSDPVSPGFWRPNCTEGGQCCEIQIGTPVNAYINGSMEFPSGKYCPASSN